MTRMIYGCCFPNSGLDKANFTLDVAQVQNGLVDINYRDCPKDESYWGLWRVKSIEIVAGKPVLVLHSAAQS